MRARTSPPLAHWAVFLLAATAAASLNAQTLDQYLEPTLEAQADPADPMGDTFHPDLVAKANELETPLRMFEFVYDEIEYEVYRYSLKGALGTLWSGRGNDYDQASLLIALLRAKGVRARYARHWVTVPMQQAQHWGGTPDVTSTQLLFNGLYCGIGQLCINEAYDAQPSHLRLDHVWVEVEASTYRGVAADGSEPVWIPLDPSWKQKDFQAGIANLPISFDYDAYYSKVDPRLPSEIWEAQIRSWLKGMPGNLSPADVPYDGPIRRLGLEVLPLSLPFDPAAFTVGGPPLVTYEVQRYADIDGDPQQYALSIAVAEDSSLVLVKSFTTAPDLVHRRLTLSFEPRNDATREAMLAGGGYLGGSPSLLEFCLGSPGNSKCEVVPVIKIDGVVCGTCRDAENRKVALGKPVVVRVNGAEYPVIAGNYMSIGFDVDHAGQAQVDARIERLLSLRDSTILVDEGEGDLNLNQVFGEVLIDQGSGGITQCPDYAAPAAIDECDISIAANYKKNDDFIGEMLHLGTLRYFQRVREEDGRLFALNRLATLLEPAVGMTMGGLSVEYLFDRPVSVEPSDPVLDVRGLTTSLVFIDGGDRTTTEGKLLAHVDSALEHQVWEELTGREFVSTVKGFQIVRERFPAEQIRTFDSTNASEIQDVLLDFPFDTSLAAETFEDTIAAIPDIKIITPVAAALGDGGGADVYIYEVPTESSVTFQMRINVRGIEANGAGPYEETPSYFQDLGLLTGDANLVGPSFVTADPVSMVSGNNYLEQLDLRIPTNGPPLEFARAYNSQSEHVGELGFGWTHAYEIRVEPPQQEQAFVYLPAALSGFDEAGEVDGARSDSVETWTSGTGAVETAQWPALPAAFTGKATIERLELELTYDGAFSFQLWNGTTQVLGTTAVPNSNNEIALETYAVTAPAPAGPYELRLTNGFGGSDRLFSARLRIHFRGPRLERVALPNVPASSGWSNLASLADGDPSSCATPSGSTPPALVFSPATDLEGAVAIEVSAAVKSVGNSSRATLRLGSPGAGPSFLLGPNEAGSARLRFLTLNTAHASDATFQTITTPIVELCHLERTLLRMRDEVELVLATGVRERFTRANGVWQGGAGVRNVLTDRVGGGYVVTRPDGSTLEIGKGLPGGTTWRLSRIADAQGRGVTLDYDSGTHHLLRARDEGDPDRFLVFTYEAGRDYLAEIEDWSGRTWRYTVDPRGDLVEFENPRAIEENWQHGIRYEYEFGHAENPDLDHNLKRVIEPEDRNADGEGDRWVEFSYYNNDKVSSHTDSAGNTYTFLFNVPRLENQTTDPRGLTTVYRHDTDGNLVQRRDPDGAVWEWAYDEDRNVVREIDPFGRAREFLDFDEKGNPGEVRDRDWSPPSFTRSTNFTYDPVSGQPATVVDKRGHTRTVAYTEDGLPSTTRATIGATEQAPGTLLSTNEYNAARRLVQTNEAIGDGLERETHFFYDPTARDLIRVESWDGGANVIARVELEYDVLGRPRFRRVEREASATDPTLVELVTETQYDSLDQVVRVVQPDGTVLVSAYDKNGNLTRQHLEERRPDGQIVQHGLTQLFYDAIDRLVEAVDAADGTTTFAYDAAGNRVATTDPEGNTWRTEYDAMNRPVRVVDPNGAATSTSYDAAGRVEKTADATGLETMRTYDKVGRLIAYQQGSLPAATRSIEYGEGSPTAYHEIVTDPEHTTSEPRASRYEFDGIGRAFEITDALGGVTRVAYNLLGSVKTVTDPIGKQTVFTFDTLGRALTVKPYYGGIETLAYDQTGNVIWRQKPDLCQLEQDYDAMGRLVARRTANSAGSCANGPIDEQFGYDARGLLVAAQNPAVGLIREYDALGRMRREIDTRFGTGVGYAYDKASRLTSKVYPDGGSVHYASDGAGRTVGISDPFGATTRFVYDSAGRRVQKLGTDGVVTNYTYNATTRFLSSVQNNAPGLSFALTHSYPTHDNVGNRLRTDGFGGTTHYTYDALDRLETLDPPDTSAYPANGALTEFAYDGAGNRTDFGPKSGGSFVAPHTTYTYLSLTKRLTEIRVDGALVESLGGYDGNGNPSTWTPPAPNNTPRTLKYDALGRLVSITGGFTASYVYDPFGRRIEKTEANVTTRYQYDGLDVVAEYSASQLEATYVFGPGIDEVLKLERGGVEAAFHTDGLGSVMAISAAGTYRNTYVYDAFGQVVATGGSQPLANAYTYTGRERDASGLYYYRARYYLPSAGRFLTPDPSGLSGGLNAYAYVGSNPVNYTDPFGLRAGAPLGPAGPRLPLSSPAGGAGQTVLGLGAGLVVGGGVGLAGGAAFAAGAAACLPCAVAVGGGLLAYAAYSEYSSDFAGVRSLGNSLSSVASLDATFDQAFSVGALGGSLAGGVVGARATSSFLAAGGGSGPLVFRQGTFADEAAGWSGNLVKGRQWAGENPLTTQNYAKQYGLPAENSTPDWVVGGRISGGYQVRSAPASHNNPLNRGGAPEYIPRNPDNVILEFFHMPD